LRILYIAINYRTAHHAEAFVKCFERDPRDARLVLVDNSEPHERVSLQVDPTLADAIHYCPTSGNLGYFGGARHGLSSAVAGGFDADWVVVSNVDLTFDPTQMRAVLAPKDPGQIGVIAPAITSRHSLEKLNPFMVARPTRARMHAYKHIFRYYLSFATYSWASEVVRHRAWGSPHSSTDSADRQIYAPHGALMILSREFFRRGGTLEHPPFLFNEEITIAEQARRLSLPVVYCPAITVSHEQHASVSRIPSRRHHEFVSSAAAYVADAYFR